MNDAAEVLAAWQRTEQVFRNRIADGSVRPRASPRASKPPASPGSEFLGGLLRGELPFALIAETLDFFLVEVEKGRARLSGPPERGACTTRWALCTAAGTRRPARLGGRAAPCTRAWPAGKSYTTLELKVNMVRPLTDKVPLVRAEGNVVHLGGQIATAEGTLFGPDGKLLRPRLDDVSAFSTCRRRRDRAAR